MRLWIAVVLYMALHMQVASSGMIGSARKTLCRIFPEFCTTTTPSPNSVTVTEIAKICNKSCACGKRPLVSKVRSGFEKRIVGGSEAERHTHPWLVRIIRHYGRQNGATFCGGTLINSKYVLTAAHCVEEGKKYAVIIGDHEQSEINHGIEIHSLVSKVHIHKRYSKITHDNDIALLELSKTIKFEDHIQPACIPTSSLDPPAEEAWAAGWGRLSSKVRSHPDVPLEVKIPLISLRKCRYETKHARHTHTITDNMICGGTVGKDTCQGDSGGPLVIEKRKRFEVQGVVSWGIGCGDAGYPGIYAKVYNYVGWMQDIMGTNCINCL